MKWNKNSTLIPVVSLLSSLRQKSRSKNFVLKPWILLLPIHPVRTLRIITEPTSQVNSQDKWFQIFCHHLLTCSLLAPLLLACVERQGRVGNNTKQIS